MAATVDRLAEILSEKTGSRWEILRGRPPLALVVRTNPPMRYGLRIHRGEHSHTFQAHRPMTLGELTRWLASIADMVDMGFLPVEQAFRAGFDAGWNNLVTHEVQGSSQDDAWQEYITGGGGS